MAHSIHSKEQKHKTKIIKFRVFVLQLFNQKWILKIDYFCTLHLTITYQIIRSTAHRTVINQNIIRIFSLPIITF